MSKITCLFAGDSITDANHIFTDHNLGDGYVFMIQNMHPEWKVINRGYDGFTAMRMLKDWEETLLRQKPDVITILVGINDLGVYFRGYEDYERNLFSPTHFEENYSLLIRKAKEITSMLGKSTKIICMEPFVFPWPEQYKNWIKPLISYREAVKRVAENYNLLFVPLYEIFEKELDKCVAQELTIDGIHVTKKGHAIIANAWNRAWQLINE